MKGLLCVLIIAIIASVSSQDPGQPLFLSQYLTNPTLGKQLSQVQLDGFNGLSYSGFFTVDQNYGSNMYFWFFPNVNPKAPVLVWLQGGPGGSSLFGLFGENGPFSVNTDYTLQLRQIAWTNKYSLIYIDNPVGTGFSFTQSTKGFVTNEDQVGKNLYSILYQFFQIFPEQRTNDLYITGESYAGHYVPAAAAAIHNSNKNATQKLNLKGIIVGDGLFEADTQVQGLGQLAYYLSLADEHEAAHIKEYEVKIKDAVAKKKYVDAFNLFDELLNGDFYPYPTYFYNITGSPNYFNMRDVNYPPNPYPIYVRLPEIRKKLHVGNVSYSDYNATVERYLVEDVSITVRPYLELILNNNYKVLIYNGQNDLIVSGPLTEGFLKTLKWNGASKYKAAEKMVWRIHPKDQFVAGFVRKADNLVQAIVRDAGHMVPADQPERAFDMIKRFIENDPWV